MRKLNGITINGEYLGNSVVINGMFRAICTISPAIMRYFVLIINKIGELDEAVSITNFNCFHDSIDIDFENDYSMGTASLYFQLNNGEPELTDCKIILDDEDYDLLAHQEAQVITNENGEIISVPEETNLLSLINSGTNEEKQASINNENTQINNDTENTKSNDKSNQTNKDIKQKNKDDKVKSADLSDNNNENTEVPAKTERETRLEKKEKLRELKKERMKERRAERRESNKALQDLFGPKKQDEENETNDINSQNSEPQNINTDTNTLEKASPTEETQNTNVKEENELNSDENKLDEEDTALEEDDDNEDFDEDDYKKSGNAVKSDNFTIYADSIKLEAPELDSALTNLVNTLQNNNGNFNNNAGFNQNFGADSFNNNSWDNNNNFGNSSDGGFDFNSNQSFDNNFSGQGFDFNQNNKSTNTPQEFTQPNISSPNNNVSQPNYENINNVNNDASMNARQEYAYDENANLDELSDLYADFYGSFEAENNNNPKNSVQATVKQNTDDPMKSQMEAMQAELEALKAQADPNRKLMTLEEFLAKQKELEEARENKRRQKFRILSSGERINASALEGGLYVAGKKVYKWGDTKILDK